MVRRASLPCLGALLLAALAGLILGGWGAAVSAALAIVIVYANFAVHGMSLAWASTISISSVHAVSLIGVVVRLGVIVGALFLLDRLDWFSPLAFGLAVVPATLLLLAYEARLAIRGMGGTLQIPADPAAVRAAESLAAREA